MRATLALVAVILLVAAMVVGKWLMNTDDVEHATRTLPIETERPSGPDPGVVPSDDDSPETPATRDLTPRETEEFEAFLDRAKRVLGESRRNREEIERKLEAMAIEAGFLEKLPLPPEVTPPEEPSVKFALPRALAWLAAHQRPDGSWEGGLEPDAFATAVFTDIVNNEHARVARFRIWLRLRRSQPTHKRQGALPREAAIALYVQCAIVDHFGNRKTVLELERRIERLVGMRNRDAGWGRAPRDGRFDAVASGWAIAGLQWVADLKDSGTWISHAAIEVAKIDWSTMRGNPETDAPHMIASLLRRRGTAESDDPDDTMHWLSRRLAEDLRTKKERSLDEWYLGATALKPDGSTEWKAWRSAMTDTVLRSQRRDGSWSEAGSKGLAARVRATALAVLCLRVAVEP